MTDEDATPPPTERNPMQPAVQPIEFDDQHRRLCGAHTRAGEACRAPAMDGQARCRMHGGASPRAKRKARLKLIELVDPAIATLATVMESKDAKDADRLRAAEAILDRAGHPRASRVEGAVSVVDARDMLLERIRETRARHLTAASPAALDAGEIVDAEVIDDAVE